MTVPQMAPARMAHVQPRGGAGTILLGNSVLMECMGRLLSDGQLGWHTKVWFQLPTFLS